MENGVLKRSMSRHSRESSHLFSLLLVANRQLPSVIYLEPECRVLWWFVKQRGCWICCSWGTGTVREPRWMGTSAVGSRYPATTVKTWLRTLVFVCNRQPWSVFTSNISKSPVNQVTNPNLIYSHGMHVTILKISRHEELNKEMVMLADAMMKQGRRSCKTSHNIWTFFICIKSCSTEI
jgi:hypothetical protein